MPVPTIDRYGWAIEELSLSGEVSLGACSKSTYYRWLKAINGRLAAGRYPWRVDGRPDSRCLAARAATPDELRNADGATPI